MQDSQIERLLKNYSNARKSWESWCYLNDIHLKTPNRALKIYVDKNDLLSHLRYLAFKDFHIELYKILKESKNKNNRDNIFVLLNEVEPSDPKKTEAERILIDLNKHLPEIEKLLNLRDKYFAHLDRDYLEYLNSGQGIEDIYRCYELIEKSIIILTSMENLMAHLDKIPLRNDFNMLHK